MDPSVPSIHNRHLRPAIPGVRPQAKRMLPGRTITTPFDASRTSEPPPAKYVCFKCADRGHWINDCPLGTHAKRKFRPACGIPRRMLQVIPREDKDKYEQVLILADGELAVLKEMDSLPSTVKTREWKAVAAFGFGFFDALQFLQCPGCENLMTDAVQLPCCQKTLCQACSTRSQAGASLHLNCTLCNEKLAIGQLIPNSVIRSLCAAMNAQHATVPTALERKAMEILTTGKGILSARDKPLGDESALDFFQDVGTTNLEGSGVNEGGSATGGAGLTSLYSDLTGMAPTTGDGLRELLERDRRKDAEIMAHRVQMAMLASERETDRQQQIEIPKQPPLSREAFELAQTLQIELKAEMLRILRWGMLRAKETFDISYLPPCARSTPGLIHLLSSLAPCDIDNDSNSPSPKRVKLGEDK